MRGRATLSWLLAMCLLPVSAGAGTLADEIVDPSLEPKHPPAKEAAPAKEPEPRKKAAVPGPRPVPVKKPERPPRPKDAEPAAALDNEPLTAETILRRADQVRNPTLDYTTRVTVTSKKANGSSRVHVYEVLCKGRDNAVVKTIKPPVDKGRVLLMREKDLWAFLPKVSKPLRVSFRERLIGEVANGDLARTNFSGDYTPTLTGSDTQDGRVCYVLDLKANADDVTYARVVLWVEHETFHPRRAEFYAVSGRLLKTCSYARYLELGGRLRPTQLLMNDATVKGQYSILDYDDMVIASLPDKYFTKDYLKRLVSR